MPSWRAAVIAPMAISSQPATIAVGRDGGIGEEGERRLVAARHAERGRAEVVGVDDARLVHRRPEPRQPPGVHVEVHLLVQVAADVDDAGVPEADEVTGGEPGRLLVVDAQRGDARDGAADADGGPAQGVDQFHLARGEGDADAHDRVDALAHEEVMEQPAALFRFGVETEQREVVAGAGSARPRCPRAPRRRTTG